MDDDSLLSANRLLFQQLSIAISLDLANLGDTIWAVIFTFACSLHLTSHYCLYACLHYWLGTRMLVGFVQHQDNKPTTNSTKTPPTQPKPTKHCQVWRGPSLPAELLRGARMASPGAGAEHAAPCWDGARDVNGLHKVLKWIKDIFGDSWCSLGRCFFVWRLGCIDV